MKVQAEALWCNSSQIETKCTKNYCAPSALPKQTLGPDTRPNGFFFSLHLISCIPRRRAKIHIVVFHKYPFEGLLRQFTKFVSCITFQYLKMFASGSSLPNKMTMRNSS